MDSIYPSHVKRIPSGIRRAHQICSWLRRKHLEYALHNNPHHPLRLGVCFLSKRLLRWLMSYYERQGFVVSCVDRNSFAHCHQDIQEAFLCGFSSSENWNDHWEGIRQAQLEIEAEHVKRMESFIGDDPMKRFQYDVL